MENVVPDNKNIHSYSEIWRALPPIWTRTGRQKLPSFFFHIMEDTAADNSIRTRGVQAPRDPYRQPAAWYASWPRTPGQSSVSSRHDLMTSVVPGAFSVQSGPSVNLYTSFKQMLLLSFRQYNCHNYERHCSR